MAKKTEGKKFTDELHDLKAKQRKDKFNNSNIVLMAKGLWTFAEGSALLVTSLYAVYQAHYAAMPTWGAYVLTVSGVLVLVPAALLLSKFFRAAAKEL